MKRYDDIYGQLCEGEEGDYVLFTEAQAEIDSRDKRLIALSIENRGLQHKVGHQSKLIAELAAQGKRIAALQADLAAQGKRIAALQADLANPSRFLA